MKFLILLFSMFAIVLSQAPFSELTDQMHLERLFEPYTYQRINYDLSRFAYNAQYPNNNYNKVDGWQPASWTDIFGPRKGK
ncbi:unnamed protein product [Bursaphelenchus xylophilus]|uniref:(pine wood nematode) hypothetical protein n=1 Tax=Bursaphelenchus xylophilus TaxID=6326 RepID=A0A1I7RSV9_BURXY|nr:unnamed protein product [Bursaphelenchus xylophilus]CAG9122784.1 unnamed protein product [Bursaphelenchus xylophilus]